MGSFCTPTPHHADQSDAAGVRFERRRSPGPDGRGAHPASAPPTAIRARVTTPSRCPSAPAGQGGGHVLLPPAQRRPGPAPRCPGPPRRPPRPARLERRASASERQAPPAPKRRLCSSEAPRIERLPALCSSGPPLPRRPSPAKATLPCQGDGATFVRDGLMHAPPCRGDGRPPCRGDGRPPCMGDGRRGSRDGGPPLPRARLMRAPPCRRGSRDGGGGGRCGRRRATPVGGAVWEAPWVEALTP